MNITISRLIFWKKKIWEGREMGYRQITGLCFIWKTLIIRKKTFFFPFYCFTSAFLKQMFLLGLRTKKNSLFTQLCVQPSSDIPYLTVHIPISQSAYEYPRFIHAAITPSTNQQFLAKSNSTWQMMTWSQCDSCFCAHVVLQKQLSTSRENLQDH